MKLLSRLVFPLLFVGLGYVLGGKYGAPPWVIDAYDAATSFGAEKARRVADDIKDIDIDDVADEAREDASRGADSLRSAAQDLLESFDNAHLEDEGGESGVPDGRADAIDGPEATEPTEPAAPYAPRLKARSGVMKVCLSSISNAPPTNADGTIRNFKSVIVVDGVEMLLAPVTNACLSSGYGPRGSGGRLHKGIDYYSKSGGDVLAAADGVVAEAVYRDDYGYMIVIDHGNGVYTRYAHLKRFARGVKAGRAVSQGEVLGPIGQSGAYTNIVHLHFEILRGDINAGKGSFGLTPADPYRFPRAR